MNKERNCQICIHHISGLCSKWDCEMQTLEDYRDKVIDDFAEKANKEIHMCFSDDLGIQKHIDRIAEQMKGE